MPFALMPFLAVCLLNAVHGYADVIDKLPGFLKTRLQFFLTPEGAFQVHAFAAVSEVIVTFMGPPLVVVQGYRALMLSFFYFQYVSRRYKTSQQTQQVIGLLVEKADGMFKHPRVPAGVHGVYEKAKYYIGVAASKFAS